MWKWLVSAKGQEGREGSCMILSAEQLLEFTTSFYEPSGLGGGSVQCKGVRGGEFIGLV